MRALFIFLFTLGFGLAVQAQTNPSLEKSLNDMAKNYELNTSQLTQLRDILNAKNDELAKLKNEDHSRMAYEKNMRTIQMKYDNKILGIMNEDQKMKYKQQMAIKSGALRSNPKLID
jgi:hypothetical protein